MSEESRGRPGEFTAGVLVAGYRLVEQIGQGGMAVVFRAHDPRLDRHVALKILAPGLALDDAFRQRFIRESRAAAAVDDPHIIPVFEAGEEQGVLFIAMRLVRGGDVRSLLDRDGPLPPGRATEIISQVASALDAAHARGLVHRDVKPANMLLDASAHSDRPDHVYLSDFGLSKASLGGTGLTSAGQFLGTLDYVAPEQIEGRTVTGRTDQYALACTAFELLTGAPPFRRDQGMAVVYARVSEAPPPLSARRAGLPAGADEVMNRALATSPADRYTSCREFAGALRQVLGPGRAGYSPTGSSPAGSSPADRAPTRSPTQIAMPVLGSAADSAALAGEAAAPSTAEVPSSAEVPSAAEAPSATGSSSAAAAVSGPDDRSSPGRPAASPGGPPTEAASYPAGRRTRPGRTEPPGGPRGPGGPTGPGGPGGPAGPAGHSRPPHRRWWRPAATLAAVCLVVVLAGGGSYYLLGNNSVSGLAAPGCSTSVARAPTLSKVVSDRVTVGGQPFAVRETPDGRHTFVTVGDGIAVLRNDGGLAPTLLRRIHIAKADNGLWITGDGRYLLAAGGHGAVVISVAAAEQGAADPVVGRLESPRGNGAVGVVTSPDGSYAFVTLQNTTSMAVFNLGKALSSGFGQADFVGYVPLGVQPVGVTSSPDGKWLYVTSLQRFPGPMPAEGTLSVVSMQRAERAPAKAVVSTVNAGCSPARVITDGSTVWVTARDSNTLIGYSASRLRSDPAGSIVAEVKVGMAPIGLTFAAGHSRIVVADSDLNATPGRDPGLAVVSTAAALAGKDALLGTIPAGVMPRQLTLAARGKTLLVTDEGSGQLQAANLRHLR